MTGVAASYMEERNDGMLAADRSTVPGEDAAREMTVWELGEQVRKGAIGKLVRVRGVVVQVSAVYLPKSQNRFSYVYGELRDESNGPAMAFRCRADETLPHAGERTLLEGRVEVSFNQEWKRFELRLGGKRVGTWGEDVPLTQITPTLQRRASEVERTRSRVGVAKLVRETPGRILLIGTRTGTLDIQRAAERVGSRMVFETVITKVLRWREMLDAARDGMARYDGVCLVRGGGDPEDFACWNEAEFVRGLLAGGKPFYTALGHSDYELTLADLRADESFGTPAEFGAAYATSWKEETAATGARGEAERKLEQERRHVATLESLVASEQRSRALAVKELGEAVARRQVLWARMKVLLWVCGGLLLVVVLLIWLK